MGATPVGNQGNVQTRKQLEWFDRARQQMIERQLRGRGIANEKVLRAFEKVRRELFVAPAFQAKAYDDQPLPIGFEQTISQPYVVAFMTEQMAPTSKDRILEIGTGSGYQTAILAELVKEVYSVEMLPELHERAKSCLEELGYRNIFLKLGDGREGWPEHAPFDHVIVTAAAEEIPDPLREQVVENGTVVIPIGIWDQDLVLARKRRGVFVMKQLMRVRFVPLKGE